MTIHNIKRFRIATKLFFVGVLSCALLPIGCRNEPVQSTGVDQIRSVLESPQQTTVAQVTAKKPAIAPVPVIPKPIDRTKPIVGENGATYTPGQFHKNSSLLVLAFEPDIRADYVIMTTRKLLNDDQSAEAKKLALTYENQFKELIRERAAVLENASDRKDIDRDILKVQMKLADLLRQIRNRINLEIMTHEQRVKAMEIHKAYLKAKADKEARDRATLDRSKNVG